ncbi:MAG: SlyX family protein [Gammaproteobacteria bacterium]|nr:SlyX family protein [Gammaproteobacteria bacterium]
MSEERIIELETRVAYQEDAIAELSSAIALQSGRIETLELKVDALIRRLREVVEANANQSPDEQPPHY